VRTEGILSGSYAHIVRGKLAFIDEILTPLIDRTRYVQHPAQHPLGQMEGDAGKYNFAGRIRTGKRDRGYSCMEECGTGRGMVMVVTCRVRETLGKDRIMRGTNVVWKSYHSEVVLLFSVSLMSGPLSFVHSRFNNCQTIIRFQLKNILLSVCTLGTAKAAHCTCVSCVSASKSL
jgi:hypothetical protein